MNQEIFMMTHTKLKQNVCSRLKKRLCYQINMLYVQILLNMSTVIAFKNERICFTPAFSQFFSSCISYEFLILTFVSISIHPSVFASLLSCERINPVQCNEYAQKETAAVTKQRFDSSVQPCNKKGSEGFIRGVNQLTMQA